MDNMRKAVEIILVTYPNSNKRARSHIEKITEIQNTLDIPDDKTKIVYFDDQLTETLKQMHLPELWFHDFTTDSDLSSTPIGEYYFIKFDDGTVKTSIIIDDGIYISKENKHINTEMMYQ